MSSSVTKVPVRYLACHRRNLDDKRRLQIPAKWYSKTDDGKIEPIQFALILWPHDEQPDMCIHVLPPAKFDALWQKVTSMAFGDTEGQALRRLLGEKAELVDLDSAGRVMVPEQMAAVAGLTAGGEAVMNGMFDSFQIWSPERYEATRAGVAAKAPNAFKMI
jgi:MraZ protein